jgi:hypothetical protein
MGKLKDNYDLVSKLAQSSAWLDRWKKTRVARGCGPAKKGYLCGAEIRAGTSNATALLVATSPSYYDARNPQHTGKGNVAGKPGKQGTCGACVAFALASAVDAAVDAVCLGHQP